MTKQRIARQQMDTQQLESISKFLKQVGRESLFEYLDISEDVTDEEAKEAIKSRRSWAQGQQANPKYRNEAIWFIKNATTLRKVLLESRSAYLEHLHSAQHQEHLGALRLFIMGAMADGVLSARAEASIRARGRRQGLPDQLVIQTIEQQLKEQHATRQGVAAEVATDPTMPSNTPDHYSVLGVAPAASMAELEAAYRSRYRQAGRLDSSERARLVYAELDAAWNVLRDPIRRATYDKLSSRRPATSEPAPAATSLNLDRSLTDDSLSSEVPRLPDGLKQRIIQPVHAPRLEVDGPETMQLSVGRAPSVIKLMVRNLGSGRMSGRIHADRPWVVPSPSRLDPLLKEQGVELTILPDQMPRRRGKCRVTIHTRTAGNRSVMLEVQRAWRLSSLLSVAGALLAVLVVGAATVLYTPAPPRTGRLIIGVDPPAGEIYINDTLVSTQGALDSEAGFPIDVPFTLRVQTDGFSSWSQEVLVPAGETVVLKPVLQLEDPMDFVPDADWEEGGIDSEALQAEIREHTSAFNRCFSHHLSADPGFTAIIDVKGYVNQLGKISRLEFQDRNFTSDAVDHCLTRQFRALSLPLLNPRYDYGTFEHIFHYTVPPKP